MAPAGPKRCANDVWSEPICGRSCGPKQRVQNPKRPKIGQVCCIVVAPQGMAMDPFRIDPESILDIEATWGSFSKTCPMSILLPEGRRRIGGRTSSECWATSLRSAPRRSRRSTLDVAGREGWRKLGDPQIIGHLMQVKFGEEKQHSELIIQYTM